MKAIVTIPPYAPYIEDVAKHPIVEGLRLNTVMPVKESLDDLLNRLKDQACGKDIWIDLKGRQLRVKRAQQYSKPKKAKMINVDGKRIFLDPSNPKTNAEIYTPPWSCIELDHKIELDTTEPVRCFLKDGYETALIVAVEDNKLYMLDGPHRPVGSGESINIPHHSLKIDGYFTGRDIEYIEAAKQTDLHNYMMSYVEHEQDIDRILEYDPLANIVAKIESPQGLSFAKNYQKTKNLHLMAARGDLYVEVNKPHMILGASRDIIEKDKNAIVASRICSSLVKHPMPECQDISDMGFLLEIGYRRFMIGDDVCFNRDYLFSALNLLQAIKEDYKEKYLEEYKK